MTDREKLERVDRDLTIAFRSVFGDYGSRTKEQSIVLARLRELARPGKSQYLPGQDERALAFAQGRLRLWDEITKRINPTPATVYQLLGITESTGDDDHDD